MGENKMAEDTNMGTKSKTTTIIFWLFSIHRFYLGKIGTAILYLFTIGGLGIWALIDLISILNNSMTDSDGKKLKRD
jgi:TM2 domain-containing membrane protein YozV